MHTGIDMNGNNITGANTVSASGVSVTGAVSANSVSATGAVSASSLSATGAVSANSLSATTVSIGGQSVDASRAALLNQIYGLNCPAGQVLTAQAGTASCVVVDSVPSGTIAAFIKACPAGWGLFTAANGRFLVGTGSDGLGNTYALNESLGKAAVALAMSNLPLISTPVKSGTSASALVSGGTPTNVDIRPPYYAVNWCQKT
jgi:hypothetical protein